MWKRRFHGGSNPPPLRLSLGCLLQGANAGHFPMGGDAEQINGVPMVDY